MKAKWKHIIFVGIVYLIMCIYNTVQILCDPSYGMSFILSNTWFHFITIDVMVTAILQTIVVCLPLYLIWSIVWLIILSVNDTHDKEYKK